MAGSRLNASLSRSLRKADMTSPHDGTRVQLDFEARGVDTQPFHADPTLREPDVLALLPRTNGVAHPAVRRLTMTRFAMLTAIGAAVVVAQSFSFPVLAQDVPNFDLRKTCKTDVQAFQGTAGGQASNPGCVRDEQEARATLVSQWAQFAPTTKRECMGLQGDAAGPQSYVELLTCLQMASPDKKFK